MHKSNIIAGSFFVRLNKNGFNEIYTNSKELYLLSIITAHQQFLSPLKTHNFN